MFNPDAEYGQNALGEPEFGTITITVDDVSNNPELGNDVVQKIVLSTQDLIAAIAAQAVYFGEPGLLGNPTHGRLLLEAGRQPNPVFVYVTPRANTIQIITSTPTWDMLVQHPDFGRSSSLVAMDKLQDVVSQTLANLQQFAGGIPSLSLLDLTPGETQVSASSEGGEGETAQQMAGSSAFEDVGDRREDHEAAE